MMEKLRTASNNVVLKIILGLILISFMLTGVGNYLIGGNSDYAAKVDGETISRAQLENAYNNERARQQQAMGDNYAQLSGNTQFLQQIRQQALSQLIDQQLLQNYVKSLHLAISDEQIKQAIYQVPEFQKSGHFDNETFNLVLSQVGYTPEEYAKSLRKSLANRQLANGLANNEFMLPGETQQLIDLFAQRREARQAVFNIAALANQQTVSDQEIQLYYQQHQAEFINPEQFRLSYIKLDAKAMQMTPTPVAVRKWYDSHQADYTQPSRQRYSVIQVKTEAEAKGLLTELHRGASFTDLARQNSQDPISAQKGGDLGWMEQASVPDEIQGANLKDKGALSEVIKSSVGFLIIKLTDFQPAQVQPFSAVAEQVAAKVKQEAAITQFYQLQSKVNDAANSNNQSLAGAEQVAGVKAVQTAWFSRDNLPNEINFEPIKQALNDVSLLGQDNQPGNNSGVIPVEGDRAFVIRIVEHKAENEKPLDQVSSQIRDTLKHQKALSTAKVSAEKVVAELKQGKTDALNSAGLKFGASITYDRSHPAAVTTAVFNLPAPSKDKISYGTAEDAQGNVVILAVERTVPGELPADQKQSMVDAMAKNNAQLVFEALLQDLRHSAKISYGNAAKAQ